MCEKSTHGVLARIQHCSRNVVILAGYLYNNLADMTSLDRAQAKSPALGCLSSKVTTCGLPYQGRLSAR